VLNVTHFFVGLKLVSTNRYSAEAKFEKPNINVKINNLI
jgi:hypothetical protein